MPRTLSLDRSGEGELVNRHAALNQGLSAWWLSWPATMGGRGVYDIAGHCHGTFAATHSAVGWRGTTRPGGMGHILLDSNSHPTVYVRVPITAQHKPPAITVAGWARQDFGFPYVVYAVEYRSDGTGSPPIWSLKLGFHNDTAQFRVAVNATQRQALSPALPLRQWHHLAGTYDGATVRVFVNGRQAASTTGTAGPVDWGTSADAGIGRTVYSSTPQEGMRGAIDDVRVWSRAMSAEEIFEVYADSMTGYASTLRRTEAGYLSSGPSAAGRPWLYRRRPSILGTGVV